MLSPHHMSDEHIHQMETTDFWNEEEEAAYSEQEQGEYVPAWIQPYVNYAAAVKEKVASQSRPPTDSSG